MTIYLVAFVAAVAGAALGVLMAALAFAAHDEAPLAPSPSQRMRDETARALGRIDPALPRAQVAPQRPYSIAVRRREGGER